MGGRRNQGTEFAGRPKSDANYGQKKRFGNNDRHEGPKRYNDRGPKDIQLFKATCTTCGKPCEVPFRPNGQKPVLCRDCFAAKNTSPSGNDNFKRNDRDSQARPNLKSENRNDSFRPPVAQHHSDRDHSELTKKVAALESKLNEILTILKQPKPEVKEKTAPVKETAVAETKSSKPKKVAKKAVKKVFKKKK